jgi:hypothetical protein
MLFLGAWMIALPASAQVSCPHAGDSTAAAVPQRPPDVLIRARVTARSVRFERSPRVEVTTLGCAPWDSVVVTERVNLPDPVEPGVIYNDVRIGVEIRSWLDLLCTAPADQCARILGVDSIPETPR